MAIKCVGSSIVGGTFSMIDVPGASYTRATGVNDAGHIVGYFGDSEGVGHGFLDVDDAFSTIDVPGASLTFLSGINSAGNIVGNGWGFPFIPEPTSLTIFSVGLLGLGLAFRRQLQ
jgi:probable HAF family extracellular repeat protein